MTDKVRVAVRCRPMNKKEIEMGYKVAVKMDESRGLVTLVNKDNGDDVKRYTFDKVFGAESKQIDVFTKIAYPIVHGILEGYNGTVFAYGQTGTGKTFTMEGVLKDPDLKGVIPHSFEHVFTEIAKADDISRFLFRVSYVEIYNEECRDLLISNSKTKLDVKERPGVGVFVHGLSSYGIHSSNDLSRVMHMGNKNRMVGCTNMNSKSSRSHAIFTLTVERTVRSLEKAPIKMGKLNLVDLAGSERQSKTGASGLTLKEATKINLSLSTLGNVISSLVDGKSKHIPYRNSKLTRLLQDSLGGNSRTVMIANVGPADYNYDETITTLRYANRAKDIKNKARINEDPKDALLRQYQIEIDQLKSKLQRGSKVQHGLQSNDSSSQSDSDSYSEDETITGDNVKRSKKTYETYDPQRSEKITSIKSEIKQTRRKLGSLNVKASAQRKIVEDNLQKKENQLKRAQGEQKELRDKLAAIEGKIIVGGMNLFDKAEEQQKLLNETSKELKLRNLKEKQMRQSLDEKEQERIHIEKKYSNLSESAIGKKRKLKKLWNMMLQTKNELVVNKKIHESEIESLVGDVRQLSIRLRRQMMVIDSYIPVYFQHLIDHNTIWNNEIGEWQISCLPYTGNKIKKEDKNVVAPKKMSSSDLRKKGGKKYKTRSYFKYPFGRVKYRPQFAVRTHKGTKLIHVSYFKERSIPSRIRDKKRRQRRFKRYWGYHH